MTAMNKRDRCAQRLYELETPSDVRKDNWRDLPEAIRELYRLKVDVVLAEFAAADEAMLVAASAARYEDDGRAKGMRRLLREMAEAAGVEISEEGPAEAINRWIAEGIRMVAESEGRDLDDRAKATLGPGPETDVMVPLEDLMAAIFDLVDRPKPERRTER